jgi:hypothetical protein
MIGGWHEWAKQATDDELDRMLTAARQAGHTNCGWWEERTAKQLIEIIGMVNTTRGRNRA